MDNKRRAKLQEVIRKLDELESIVDAVCDKEQDCMDNIPENLQGTDRCEQMEAAVDNLTDALQSIAEARENIELAMIR